MGKKDYKANNWGLNQMDKKQVELVREAKSSLKEIETKFSQLEILFKDLLEANRTCRVPNSKFKIKHFKRGDLS